MRKRFQQQLSVDIIPIPLVNIPDYKRHELEPVLKGLQYIFTNVELNQQVFLILEEAILSGKKRQGAQGWIYGRYWYYTKPPSSCSIYFVPHKLNLMI